MALVVKKKKGQSQQQLINEFRRLTWLDPLIEKVKDVAMSGHIVPSKKRHEKKKEVRKELAKIRRRNKRNRR